MKSIVENIFIILEKQNPNPSTELEFINEFTFCVAVILSAQATDKAVNKCTSDLFKIADTPEKMLNLGEEKLKEHIKTIGLFNNKAKNIIKLSHVLVFEYGSKIPASRNELEKLPGIGRKSANVIMNTLFKMPYIAVDTHVLRLSNRLGFSNSKNPLQVEAELELLVPKKFHINASNWLVLHGRYVCLAKKPKCTECKIAEFCQYYKDK